MGGVRQPGSGGVGPPARGLYDRGHSGRGEEAKDLCRKVRMWRGKGREEERKGGGKMRGERCSRHRGICPPAYIDL